MRLSIIVPHYKEDETTLRRLLNSIDNQRQIDFKQLEVIIVNDHSDVPLPEHIGKGYKFPVRLYRLRKNGGPGVARQYGVDKAKGEYILFIDADDCLISCISLRWIFAYKGAADIIRGRFFNENANKVDNGWTWVHGKFYRREFLINSGLRFPAELRVNEDSFFNMLAGAYATETVDIDEIVTFWSKNMKSLTRTDSSAFTVNCFGDFYKGKILGFRELSKNGYTEELRANLIDLFVYSYYYFQVREFYRGGTHERRKLAEYEKTLASIVAEFWGEFRTFTETDFDIKLSEVYKQFDNYVDYRPRETFDSFRERILRGEEKQWQDLKRVKR